MTIYVGNLPYSATEDEIKALFERSGEVKSVKLITDKDTGKAKGFGFIEMENNDQAKEAITQLDGSDLNGRNMKVNEARPRT